MNKIKQNIDLRKFRLCIDLSGNDFDGMLNFGAIVLVNENKKYLMDIVETEGFKQEDAAKGYQLISKFEDDLEETEDMFADMGYDFNQDLKKLLSDPETKAYINLEYHGSGDADLKASLLNIDRIESMKIIHIDEPEKTVLKVMQSNQY
jgi:hypothetical protein